MERETKQKLVEALTEIAPEYTVSKELYSEKVSTIVGHDGTDYPHRIFYTLERFSTGKKGYMNYVYIKNIISQLLY